jgi:hypothetical protein
VGAVEKFFQKIFKEGVDSLVSLYIFVNPSRDFGHSPGIVLHQSATKHGNTCGILQAESANHFKW